MKFHSVFHLVILLILFHRNEGYSINITLTDVPSTKVDQYICKSFAVANIDRESYIISYEPLINNSVAHHMLLFGCYRPFVTTGLYDCQNICGDKHDKIVYVWAHNAQSFHYPENTGMPIGGRTGINFLTLQVHFVVERNEPISGLGFKLTLTRQPQPQIVGIIMMFAYYGSIAADSQKSIIDVSCKYSGPSGYPLGFRTHAHALGRVISGYRVSHTTGDIDLIGRGNPQWPQNFYRPAGRHLIRNNDILLARCMYNSTGRHKVTDIGATHMDEMCNFFIMLVTKNNDDFSNFFKCAGNEYADLMKNLPTSSVEPLPEHPDPTLELNYDPIQNYQRFSLSKSWKVQSPMGEVPGISVLRQRGHETLLVLHRSNRHWIATTFHNNIYAGDHSKPIKQNIIQEVDIDSGAVLASTGAQAGLFMPHGITADPSGRYLWVTDVALHQVMRYPITGEQNKHIIQSQPDMVLGEKFVPGNDKHHFCQPAKVAIDQAGNILVADGYCNNRIICFSANGTYAGEWRPPIDDMFVVHGLTLQMTSDNFRDNLVWVADRGNQRVLVFSYDGSLQLKYGGPTIFPMQVFALDFNPQDKMVYGVETDLEGRGSSFTILTDDEVKLGPEWIRKEEANILNAPHDLALARNGSLMFVAELYQKKVLRFERKLKFNSMSQEYFDSRTSQFTKSIDKIVHRIKPLYFGLSLLTGLFVVLFCIVLTRLIIRCRRNRRNRHNIGGIKINANGDIVDSNGGNKWFNKSQRKRREPFGNLLNDKEGFQPLNQDEPDDGDEVISRNIASGIDDDDDDDQETEEFSVSKHLMNKRPKV